MHPSQRFLAPEPSPVRRHRGTFARNTACLQICVNRGFVKVHAASESRWWWYARKTHSRKYRSAQGLDAQLTPSPLASTSMSADLERYISDNALRASKFSMLSIQLVNMIHFLVVIWIIRPEYRQLCASFR